MYVWGFGFSYDGKQGPGPRFKALKGAAVDSSRSSRGRGSHRKGLPLQGFLDRRLCKRGCCRGGCQGPEAAARVGVVGGGGWGPR